MLRATATKVDAPPPLDLTGFAELAAASDLPAVAIGGITPADMRSLRLSGAVGAAIVSGIFAWRHRVLVAAKPYFRTAMVKRLTAALEQGLAPGHADRALSLVAEDGLFDAECLLLQRALQLAWTDQRVGMCADCGDLDRHSPGCSQFDFSWDDGAADAGADHQSFGLSLSRPAAADPLALLLQRPVNDDPDQLRDDAEIVEWMTVQLARQIAEAPDREATLRATWSRWRAKLKPGQRQLLDHASEHVRYALDLRRVS